MSDEEDDPPKCGDEKIDADKRNDKDNPPGRIYAIGWTKRPYTRFTEGPQAWGTTTRFQEHENIDDGDMA